MELASERKRQSVLRMELEWAKRGCRARSTKQRARLERLEALKNGKAPVRDANVELDSVETRMGKKTIELHHISKSLVRRRSWMILIILCCAISVWELSAPMDAESQL